MKKTGQRLESDLTNDSAVEGTVNRFIEQFINIFKTGCDASLGENPYPTLEKEMVAEMKKAFDASRQRFVKGYTLLLDDARQTKQNLYPYLIDEKLLTKLKNTVEIENKLKEGMELFEIFGLSQDALSTFYKTALYLLEHNKHEEAGDAFFYLSLSNPRVATFWQGLARSEAALNHKEEALAAYKAALLVEESNHELYSEAVRYAVEQQDGKSLQEFLDIAVKYAENHPKDPASSILSQSALKLKQELSWILIQNSR